MAKIYRNGIYEGEFFPSDEWEQQRQKLIKDITKFEKDNNISHVKMCRILDKGLKRK